MPVLDFNLHTQLLNNTSPPFLIIDGFERWGLGNKFEQDLINAFFYNRSTTKIYLTNLTQDDLISVLTVMSAAVNCQELQVNDLNKETAKVLIQTLNKIPTKTLVLENINTEAAAIIFSNLSCSNIQTIGLNYLDVVAASVIRDKLITPSCAFVTTLILGKNIIPAAANALLNHIADSQILDLILDGVSTKTVGQVMKHMATMDIMRLILVNVNDRPTLLLTVGRYAEAILPCLEVIEVSTIADIPRFYIDQLSTQISENSMLLDQESNRSGVDLPSSPESPNAAFVMN